MKLDDRQIREFDENGYLILRDLFSAEEIAALSEDIDRLSAIETDHIFRKGAIRTIYRAHEKDGPTASRVFHAASRVPRVLGPVSQLLRDDQLYVYNSKINGKDAVTGIPMLWHQDYGYWKLDRVPTANMCTYMITLADVDELSGCLYAVPGSHKLGTLKHLPDSTTTYHKQWVVDRDEMIGVLRDGPKPVPLKYGAGSVVIFHCNLIHGSGHNLSGHDRWQVYFAYNPVANKPAAVGIKRPDYMRSMNFAPLVALPDDAILAARRIAA